MLYLFAYIAPNTRIMRTIICANNQSQAIEIFNKENPACEILAITKIVN